MTAMEIWFIFKLRIIYMSIFNIRIDMQQLLIQIDHTFIIPFLFK